MIASEQLHTRLYLAADTERAAGLLLQKLPIEGGHAQNPDEDAWDRAQLLANTVKPEELLQVDPQTLLRRLFWEETLRVFEPQPVTFHCSCTREKVADVLLMLGQADVQELISERGEVLVHCDYCNQAYTFDPVDVTQLFNTGSPHAGILPPGAARH